MTNLSNVRVKDFYFSPSDNVVGEFFIPVLKESERYDRASGYFTSSALVEVCIGVCDLARRGGSIRIITSPRLFPDDLKAIKDGYDRLETVGKSMVDNFEKPTDPDAINRLSLLSELISLGVLKIKVAVMKNLDQYPDAMFHTKFGIMGDSEGNRLAFTGSMNESKNGLGGNWDHIEVTPAEPQFSRRVDILQDKFDKLWENKDETTEVFDMPRVVEDLINGYHVGESKLDLDEILLEKYAKKPSVYFQSPAWLENNKRDYQEKAIEEWVNNGYRGIFNMATGTGKTKTALRALERLYNDKPDEGIFTIIIAPQKHLVDQWAEEIRNFSVTPIVGHSDSAMGSWKEKFRRQVMRYRRSPGNMCLVTTISSFSSKDVQEWLPKIENLAIVSDEAHNMGSTSRLQKLPDNAKYRLALSATIDRYKDKSGTLRLQAYFGKECINFPLEDAIGKYLSNYNYYPVFCSYNSSEYDLFVGYNEHLDAVLKSSASEREKRQAKKEYIQYSYTLNSKMESKFDTLYNLMRGYVDKDHFLVYSGKVRTDDEGDFDEDSHGEMLKAIDKTVRILGLDGLGMKVSRITYKESAQDRKRIIKEFDAGETQGIVAISCLDEGVDIPSIRTAVIMSSSSNPREYIQRRGRVLRMCPGKDFAEIYDFVVIPKALDEVDPNGSHSGLELKMIAKEVKRMIEFARPALNCEYTEEMLKQILHSYAITKEDLMDVYGEDDDE